jgi:hypothetical protein
VTACAAERATNVGCCDGRSGGPHRARRVNVGREASELPSALVVVVVEAVQRRGAPIQATSTTSSPCGHAHDSCSFQSASARPFVPVSAQRASVPPSPEAGCVQFQVEHEAAPEGDGASGKKARKWSDACENERNVAGR